MLKSLSLLFKKYFVFNSQTLDENIIKFLILIDSFKQKQ